MRYILGVDGGGTGTRALLTDTAGKVWGRGSGGPANFHSVGITQAVKNVCDAAAEAAEMFRKGSTPDDIAMCGGSRGRDSAAEPVHIVLGLAGVGRAGDAAQMRPSLETGLRERLISHGMTVESDRLTLTTDARIALTGAVGGADGVVVIAGTGAIAFGTRDGRVERAGGWGYLLDDRGSGYDLGRQAIMAALRAFDGRGPATVLTGKICRYWQLAEITDLVAPVHSGEINRAQIGELAALTAEAAAEGDRTAQAILREGGGELARMALAVARRLGLTGRFKIAGTGGILSRQVAFLYPAFVTEIQREYPEAAVGNADLEPVCGAVLLGAQQLGLPIQPIIRRWNDGNEIKPGEAE